MCTCVSCATVDLGIEQQYLIKSKHLNLFVSKKCQCVNSFFVYMSRHVPCMWKSWSSHYIYNANFDISHVIRNEQLLRVGKSCHISCTHNVGFYTYPTSYRSFESICKDYRLELLAHLKIGKVSYDTVHRWVGGICLSIIHTGQKIPYEPITDLLKFKMLNELCCKKSLH